MDAVRADQQIAALTPPIGENGRRPRVVLVDGDTTRPERDVLFPDRGPKHIVEVRPMHVVERRTPTDLARVAQRHPADDFAALPVAKVPRL